MTHDLPIMEEFFTIQGEGKYTGTPAYFIRLGGCDVGCVWCDVKESWDAQSHSTFGVDEIIDRAAKKRAEGQAWFARGKGRASGGCAKGNRSGGWCLQVQTMHALACGSGERVLDRREFAGDQLSRGEPA